MDVPKKPVVADVRAKLAHIRTLKGQLDASDTELGQLVSQVEATLDSLRLGVPINRLMNEPGGVFLCFQKVGKQWRLTVDTVIDDREEKRELLSDVARDRRAEIIERELPGILDTAVTEIERRLKQRENAISTAKTLVTTVSDFVSEGEAPAAGAFKKEEVKLLDHPLYKAAATLATTVEAATKSGARFPKKGKE